MPSQRNAGIVITEAPPPDIELSAVAMIATKNIIMMVMISLMLNPMS
jgi:hypothetical protein